MTRNEHTNGGAGEQLKRSYETKGRPLSLGRNPLLKRIVKELRSAPLQWDEIAEETPISDLSYADYAKKLLISHARQVVSRIGGDNVNFQPIPPGTVQWNTSFDYNEYGEITPTGVKTGIQTAPKCFCVLIDGLPVVFSANNSRTSEGKPGYESIVNGGYITNLIQPMQLYFAKRGIDTFGHVALTVQEGAPDGSARVANRYTARGGNLVTLPVTVAELRDRSVDYLSGQPEIDIGVTLRRTDASNLIVAALESAVPDWAAAQADLENLSGNPYGTVQLTTGALTELVVGDMLDRLADENPEITRDPLPSGATQGDYSYRRDKLGGIVVVGKHGHQVANLDHVVGIGQESVVIEVKAQLSNENSRYRPEEAASRRRIRKKFEGLHGLGGQFSYVIARASTPDKGAKRPKWEEEFLELGGSIADLPFSGEEVRTRSRMFFDGGSVDIENPDGRSRGLAIGEAGVHAIVEEPEEVRDTITPTDVFVGGTGDTSGVQFPQGPSREPAQDDRAKQERIPREEL